ncbi:MAG: ABC transporter ATP-binding protein [Chloroherpetonaceae bacterium]|nr:ABC transporter ATP-binding protein [Chthonomonadaceae bacterium]MDW8207038.1 ABC transporter ATP-binding protein [Chloroherpetonaceae bacterium]
MSAPTVAELLPDPPPAVRMENITKRFPGVVANRGVHLQVRAGTFHAVIGENGAGKSTLLNILYGRYRPDAGRIFLHGEEVTQELRGPIDAIRHGIGLVSQHHALIPALSLLENVVLGSEPVLPGGVLDWRRAAARIQSLAKQLGLGTLDLSQRAERLSVAAQQKVEILKALYRGARILLLDEPTATLAPQEAEALFALLRGLVQRGTTVVFVTHKLREVMAHSDAVSVLRAGRNAGDFVTRETDERTLLQCMMGARSGSGVAFRVPLTGELEPDPALPVPGMEAAVFRPIRPLSGSPLFQIEHATVRNLRGARAVQDVSLEVGMGEIVGVAGVDGSGQQELAEAIIGLRPMETGRLFLAGVELTRMRVRARQRQGIAYIPEDRHRSGLVLDFDIAENYLLGHEDCEDWGGGWVLKPAVMFRRAAEMVQRYDVRTGFRGVPTPVRDLSGGNQQKVVFARAMESRPRFVVACQPTRGLDVEATRFVYRTLLQARERGAGVLLFSLDLDELLYLSDRVAVMFNGRIVGLLPRDTASAERIGALMTGSAEAMEGAS